MRLYFLKVLACCILPVTSIFAQNQTASVAKTPSWVTATVINYSLRDFDQYANDGYVEQAFEKQVSISEQSIYYKRALKTLTAEGVQNSSEISVNFDPTYSKVIFHTIRIIRGEQKIDKLQLSKIRLIQREQDLGMHLYDGSLSAIMFVEDVRPGDIIEYSYSIKGFNPVFNKRFEGFFETSFEVPVYNIYYKVIVPRGRDLIIKNSQSSLNYSLKDYGSEKSYEWKLEKTAPVTTEDELPSWYDPFSMIMVSEFSDWKSVNDWALKLFPFSIPLSSQLQKKIKEIKDSNNSTEKRVLAALRFVQDDIRYMGIEMGENSHRPNHPDKVFSQRFGDCKDKSYLLCAMLRALGVEADPVLINTTYKRTLKNWLPSPTAFDHTTVRVKVGDSYYWFDPTISYQRGQLKDVSYPDYETGLVITDTTTQLTDIPTNKNGMVEVKEVFDIKEMSGVTKMVVYSVYSGSFADDVRRSVNSTSKFELQKSYKEFYAVFYENIISDSLRFSDDDESGKFTMIEYYSIPTIWESNKGIKNGRFSPFVINSFIKPPKDKIRKMPYRIHYPVYYKEEVVINLPKNWQNVYESKEEYRCSAFRLNTDFSYTSKKISLKYEYETLKSYVDPAESAAFIANIKKADENMHYSISTDEKNSLITQSIPTENNTGLGVKLIAVLLLAGAIVWLTQKRG